MLRRSFEITHELVNVTYSSAFRISKHNMPPLRLAARAPVSTEKVVNPKDKAALLQTRRLRSIRDQRGVGSGRAHCRRNYRLQRAAFSLSSQFVGRAQQSRCGLASLIDGFADTGNVLRNILRGSSGFLHVPVISCVAAACSSIADAIEVEISFTSMIVLEMRLIASTAPCVSAWIVAI